MRTRDITNRKRGGLLLCWRKEHLEMTRLSGLGIWISEWDRCEGGDLSAIVRKATASGVSWVAIKAGESRSNGQVTRARGDALRGSGVECAPWGASPPADGAGGIALL